jgi:hypothetical protein
VSLVADAGREKTAQCVELGRIGLDRADGLASIAAERNSVTLADLYGHSHQTKRYKWIWIRKGALSDDSIGFPASTTEIRRFGGRARSISRVSESKVDSRSFLQVVMEGNQRGGGG